MPLAKIVGQNWIYVAQYLKHLDSRKVMLMTWRRDIKQRQLDISFSEVRKITSDPAEIRLALKHRCK